MGDLSVYSASAGSGKTYTIAREFISMMLSENDDKAYRNILAVTFTNKACEEMKSRIVKNLFLITQKASGSLVTEISNSIGIKESDIEKKSAQLFKKILHDYSFFSVYTIDSFFQKIIKNLTYELKLQSNLELELDNDRIISLLVDELMLKAESDQTLKKNIEILIEKRIEKNEKWNPKSEIKNFMKRTLDLDYRSITLDITECSKFLEKEISNFEADFDDNIKKFPENSIDIATLNKSNGSPYKYWKGYSDTSKKKSICDFEISKFTRSWVNKANSNSLIIDNYVADFSSFIDNNFKKYQTAIVLNENLYLLAILEDSVNLLYEILQREGLSLISDVPGILSKIIESVQDEQGAVSIMPFVFEKVGTAYNHFFIDEFQDTAQKQWNIFKTMLHEGLSQGNDSMIVGDVKQSIYSWRGGDWKILYDIESDNVLNHYVLQKKLDTNYRTAKNIVEFNNDFFTMLSDSMENEIPALKSIYSSAEQKFVKEENSIVKVCLFKSDKNSEVSVKSHIINNMIAEIENLQKNGVKANQITILTRSNDEASSIAKSFFTYKNKQTDIVYDVISNEALSIASNRAVKLIVSYIRYLSCPEDRLSLTNAAYLYTLEKNNVDFVSEFITDEIISDLDKALADYKEKILNKQLFEIIDILILKLNLNTEKNIPFIVSFRDIAHDFSAKSTDLQSFLEYWDEKASSETLKISENQNAIRIITIHKSKGLEADFVFIPFCDWDLEKRGKAFSDYLLVNPNNLIFPCFPSDVEVPVLYDKDLKRTIFSDIYEDESKKRKTESFNLLYVAFTRAKYGLFVYSEYPSKAELDGETKSLSKLIYSYLLNKNKMGSPVATSEGHECYEYCVGSIAAGKANAVKQSDFLTQYPIFIPSKSVKCESYINENIEGDADSVIRGNTYHKIFENIVESSDVDSAVNIMFVNGRIDEKVRNECLVNIKNAIANDHVKNWFNGSYKIYNEFSIVCNDELKRPDRVMISENEVIVLDYKFGNEKNSKKYVGQVSEYRELLTKMGYKNISCYLWYFFQKELVKITDNKSEIIKI